MTPFHFVLILYALFTSSLFKIGEIVMCLKHQKLIPSLSVRGPYWRTFLLQLLWVRRAKWPVHRHFSLHILRATSITLFLYLIPDSREFQILKKLWPYHSLLLAARHWVSLKGQQIQIPHFDAILVWRHWQQHCA